MVNTSPVRPVTMIDYTEVSFVFYSSYIIIIIIIKKRSSHNFDLCCSRLMFVWLNLYGGLNVQCKAKLV